MLTIKLTATGKEHNQTISPRLFEGCGNTLVKVICEKLYYGNPNDLENSICSYMNSSMDNKCEVNTNHVTTDLSTGSNSNGNYVSQLTFQVFI